MIAPGNTYPGRHRTDGGSRRAAFGTIAIGVPPACASGPQRTGAFPCGFLNDFDKGFA
jgi:hypothetical protein